LLKGLARHPAKLVHAPPSGQQTRLALAALYIPVAIAGTLFSMVVNAILVVLATIVFFVGLALCETFVRQRRARIEFYRPLGVLRRFRPSEMAIWTDPDPDDPTGTYRRLILQAYEEPRVQLEVPYALRTTDAEAVADHLAATWGLKRAPSVETTP